MVFIDIAVASIILSVLSGVVPVVFLKRFPRLLKNVHSILLACSGVGLLISGFSALLLHSVVNIAIPLGVPFLQGSLHLDALSGFFLCLIGIIIIPVAFYIPSYLKHYENIRQPIGSLILFTGVFVASLCLLVLAFDVFSFLFAWELMSISSYFLVIHEYQHAENRQAGLVYLLMAHLSGLLILIAFAILGNASGGFDFQTLSSAQLSFPMATIVFLLAFAGFGMKSGLVPLHVWLPQAHPVAPSHISALMSGVMLKIAVYGFIRFCFVLINQLHWQWGVLVLFIGSVSALLGVLYALMQHNLKRLLAYHSVENIGIIFIGLGLSIIFISNGSPVLGALGLIAALYHCLNHALFKSLLFLGAGSVLQQTHEHDLEHMGGLIHRMPQTAFFFLIGCISISALPPFNGFVSEWLTFQTSLQAFVLHSGIMRIVIALAAATLALTGALAAACFAKVFGIAFLGKPRTRHVKRVEEVGFGMRFSMGILAFLCLLFGVLPMFTMGVINAIPILLINVGLPNVSLNHWLWLIPISSGSFSYSALLVFVGLILFCFMAYLLKRFQYSFSFKQVSAWDCGFGGLSARMQYTATAFAMPIRRVFRGIWKVDEAVMNECDENHSLKQRKLQYELQVKDWVWCLVYQPLDHLIQKIAKKLSYFQGGNIRIYLAYTFFTMLLLLLVIS